MGKHHKTAFQEKIFSDYQIVLPKGAVFVTRNRRWSEQFKVWVDFPGRHRCLGNPSCLHVIVNSDGNHYMKWVYY